MFEVGQLAQLVDAAAAKAGTLLFQLASYPYLHQFVYCVT
jgi:hypothetical protein